MRRTEGNQQVAVTDASALTDRGATSSRRTALRVTGGGLAMALMASRLEGRVAAQDATPEASVNREGVYAVMRTRKLKAETNIDELSAVIRDGLMPLIQAIPGFVDYYVVQNRETLERTGVSIFTTKAGTDESTKVASEYLNGQGLANSYEDVNPVITEGEIVVAAL